MPVIVGVPRSGTTLLRFMLDSHPLMAIPPETGFLAALAGDCATDEVGLFRIVTAYPPEAPAWEDFGLDAEEYRRRLQRIRPFSVSEGVRLFYRLYAEMQQKPRYGEKTPTYCDHIPAIGRLLPEATFIHIIRDGRDVALSLRERWFSPGQDMTTLAAYWQRLVRNARESGSATRRYLELRYEDLVTEPQPALRMICDRVDLDFHPAMLRYWERTPERLKEHRTRRRLDGSLVVSHEGRLEQQRLTMHPPEPGQLRRWQREMTPEELSEFVRVAGSTLADMGYET